MTAPAPAQPVEYLDVMRDERALLLTLLGELTPADWKQPTECPTWDVAGIARHLLCDDVSLLSRQRDGAPPSVKPTIDGTGWEGLFGDLNAFNDSFVDLTRFLSPGVLVDLLRVTGEWTHTWYSTVDPARVGEPIQWVDPEPAPYWLLGAREYFERFIHHLQIRRALGRDTTQVTEARLAVPAIATGVRGLPLGFAVLDASEGTTVVLDVGAAGWTVARGATRWVLADGAPDTPTARLSLSLADAAALFSRGLPRDEIVPLITTDGDRDLAATVGAGLAAFFGR